MTIIEARNRLAPALLTMLALAHQPALARVVDLVDPPAATIGCTLSMEQMRRAIIGGLAVRGWTAADLESGNLVGRVNVRGKHLLEVSIRYTTTTFDVDYLTSTNLNYRERKGVQQIHPNANVWMQNVNQDILVQAQLACRI